MGMFYTTSASGSPVEYRSEAMISGSPPGPPPANRVYEKRFDEDTNAGLVSAFNGNPQAFSMVGGTVAQSGTPVTFADDGSYFAAKLRAPALLSKAKFTGDAFSREEIADIMAIAFHADGLPSS